MNSKETFNGFSAETFRFLLEIGFNNNADWFEANRKRYEQFVRDPMRRLAAALMPTALDIDGNFNPSINASVSRHPLHKGQVPLSRPHVDRVQISAHAHKRRLHALV